MDDDSNEGAAAVIEAARPSLARLVGERWSRVGRACDLVWLGFGPHREVADRGRTREISEYALHLSCPWRLFVGNRRVTGSSDIYVPPPGRTGDGDFDWDVQGANRFDVRAGELTAHLAARQVVVTSFDVNARGDLTVFLSEDFRMDVFTDDVVRSEQWRFFRPCRDEDHVVMPPES